MSHHRHIIMVDDPHITSYAAYILLKRKYYETYNYANWLAFRDYYLSQYETLTCAYCGKTNLKINSNNNNELATIDHIRPRSKGGAEYDYDNLCVCCYTCNQKKADKYEERNNN